MRWLIGLAESDVRGYIAIVGALAGTGGMVYAASRFLQKSEQITLLNYRGVIAELRQEIDRVNVARLADRKRCDDQLAELEHEIHALKLNLRALGGFEPHTDTHASSHDVGE